MTLSVEHDAMSEERVSVAKTKKVPEVSQEGWYLTERWAGAQNAVRKERKSRPKMEELGNIVCLQVKFDCHS